RRPAIFPYKPRQIRTRPRFTPPLAPPLKGRGIRRNSSHAKLPASPAGRREVPKPNDAGAAVERDAIEPGDSGDRCFGETQRSESDMGSARTPSGNAGKR